MRLIVSYVSGRHALQALPLVKGLARATAAALHLRAFWLLNAAEMRAHCSQSSCHHCKHQLVTVGSLTVVEQTELGLSSIQKLAYASSCMWHYCLLMPPQSIRSGHLHGQLACNLLMSWHIGCQTCCSAPLSHTCAADCACIPCVLHMVPLLPLRCAR